MSASTLLGLFAGGAFGTGTDREGGSGIFSFDILCFWLLLTVQLILFCSFFVTFIVTNIGSVEMFDLSYSFCYYPAILALMILI